MFRTAFEKVRHATGFFRRESGNSTVEFVIVMPLFLVLFMSTFELGLIMVRQVMLDRATDITVRTLRLGFWEISEDSDEAREVHERMKDFICDNASILPDCENNLMIELSPVSTETWQPLPSTATCVDKEEDVQPLTTFKNGTDNELMMVRVCALFEPVFPYHHLGMRLPRYDADHSYMISVSAFVNEPS
ncbi:TadE-like protein [Aliiruegeria haliotis]|uniref:TadE-like protein n=1 Tax=Aliiruegeria haliotis TaxID=1280846 RepID=A0A2T0RVS0_9RHOB|nr:TadE family protein [Aliiruegeria haliotis]PRY25264.1 TadE-like protein [Aliiruegeria haliotis]